MVAVSSNSPELDVLLHEKNRRVDEHVLELLKQYPQLSNIQNPEWWDIIERARLLVMPPRNTLLKADAQCDNFVFILSGQVRIFQHGEDGREVTLYYANAGDVCVMSLSSLLHSRPFKANAQSVTDLKLLSISSADFLRAMEISEDFRLWVMRSLSDSFCDMMETFHGTVFQRLEMRMACLLGQLFERAQSTTLSITHQQIAQELGSTREVVSRILKHLEKQGCIHLSRGQIQVGEGQQLPTSME